MSLFVLFLLTEFPVFLLAVIPNLVMPRLFFLKMITKCAVYRLLPKRFRLTKSFRFNNLSALGNEKRTICHTCRFPKDGQNLYSQPFSTFGSPSFQNLYAALGSHSSSETVGPCSFNITWLESSFHGGNVTFVFQLILN